MVQKITVALEDDLDGGPAAETLRFAFGGTEYEIDLSKKNADKLRALPRGALVASEPVLFARVKLTMSADPAVERPAVAQVNIDLNERLIRAQAAGATMRETI